MIRPTKLIPCDLVALLQTTENHRKRRLSGIFVIIPGSFSAFSFRSGMKGGGELDAIKAPLVDFLLPFSGRSCVSVCFCVTTAVHPIRVAPFTPGII
jgi:hypothetical protein